MDREAYPLDSADPTPDLVAMSPPPARVDPPWYTPKVPRNLLPKDYVQCTCGVDVWIDQDDVKHEYGDGEPHFCPDEDGGHPDSLHDLAEALQAAQDDRRGATQSDASPAPADDPDDALRGL